MTRARTSSGNCFASGATVWCLTGVGTQLFVQTAGGLAGLGITDTYQQYGWTVACVDPTGTHFQTKLGLPYGGVTYDDFAVTPDGALLFAGTALNGQFTTPGVVQPDFGGYVYTDISYPQPVPQGDAYLLRVSLGNPVPALASIFPSALFLNAALTGSTALQLYGTGFAYRSVTCWQSPDRKCHTGLAWVVRFILKTAFEGPS